MQNIKRNKESKPKKSHQKIFNRVIKLATEMNGMTIPSDKSEYLLKRIAQLKKRK